MKGQLAAKARADEDVVWLSRPPICKACTYESMWAYGNHYRVDPKIGPLHMTFDFGVVCIFKQASRNSTKDQNMVMENLNYVVFKEILVMDYLNLRLVLFKCSLIPTNTWGNATICQDEHGFWLVNFAHQFPPMAEPHVFLVIVSQVRHCITLTLWFQNVARGHNCSCSVVDKITTTLNVTLVNLLIKVVVHN